MKIVADENISSLEAFFGHFGEVQPVAGRSLTREQVRSADVLLVRSVTQVNAQLLAGSRVQFVGTCTIGTDHLDLAELAARRIAWASAPGCNAGGVVQYVLCALATLMPDWRDQKFGVIGCGKVGGRLSRTLTALGVSHQVYDPFLTPVDNPHLADLDQVLSSDVICMHTPYTTQGPHPSHHMLNQERLAHVRPGAVLINAGRGGAIDNAALLAHLEQGADWQAVLDVWEHEPNILRPLLERATLGSPHIAGYSFEGRLNGSAMIFSALAAHLGWPEARAIATRNAIMEAALGPPEPLSCSSLNQALLNTYDPLADDARMRAELLAAAPEQVGAAFDRLRKTYAQRREFGHYSIVDTPPALAQTLLDIGFNAYAQ